MTNGFVPPYDLSEIDLRHYRGLLPGWQDWPEVATVCRQVAIAVLAEATGHAPPRVGIWPAR